jgi:hypothetical protein
MVTWTSGRSLLVAALYGSVLFLGTSLFVPNHTDPLVGIPMLCGSGLVVHAWKTNRLDELGYAVIGLWAMILVVSVSLGLARAFLDTGGEIPVATGRLVGTIGLTGVLVGGYALAIRRTSDDGSVAWSR